MKKNVLLTLTLVGSLLFANISPIAQPSFVNAAPPPPTTPTPTPQPAEPSVASPALQTPPPPDRFSLAAEQLRAREAIEAVLEKYVDYWGPRYQVGSIEMSVARVSSCCFAPVVSSKRTLWLMTTF